ncbi:MAG: phosphoribosylamine--glycine ligase [Patescibacteria group bacterium]|nr:phosphoribosylamine--glycine ligase [Patescibacteria group bacterium]
MNRDGLTVLVIGSGGREDAVCWKLSQSSLLRKLFCAPGNAGTARWATNVAIKAINIQDLVTWAIANGVNFVVVTPDDPLALGLVNAFNEVGIMAFGPTLAAAQIEASKAYAAEVEQRYRIPMPHTVSFNDFPKALRYLDFLAQIGVERCVVKASGLALGKGAYPCPSLGDARLVLYRVMIDKVNGAAGDTVVIQEYLDGAELSAHAFCDGETAVMMPWSRDYKRITDEGGDMTGGMGCDTYSDHITPQLAATIESQIAKRLLQALQAEERPFKGVLYPGLMLTEQGPKVIEFNCRFGDPETQVILPRLESDLLEVMFACVNGSLRNQEVRWNGKQVVAVVLASAGYPASRQIDVPIYGVNEAEALEGVTIFHAGTKRDHSGQLLTNGGRVLNVTAEGDDLAQATERAYGAVDYISFEGMQYREKIGSRSF